MRTFHTVASLMMLLLFMSLNTQAVTAQNCNAELVVEKNRNVKSADESGATYWLELRNQSSLTSTFSIVTRNLETPCDNSNRKTSEPNVSLDLGIYTGDGRNAMPEEITVAGGQTYRFRIDVAVPQGTQYNRWSCIEVQANSSGCQGVVSTTLRVYVPDPSED